MFLFLESGFVSLIRTIYPNELAYYPTGIRLIGGIYDNLDKPHYDSLLKMVSRLKQIHAINCTIERDSAKKLWWYYF